MKKQLSGIVLSLIIVTLLVCACGKAKTAESGTPVASQGVPVLTVSPKGVDTPTAVSAKAAATPTGQVSARTQVRPTSAPAATHTPEPTDTSSPTPTPQPTATFTRLPPTSTPEPAVYVVRAGDSLAAIAQAYGVTVAALVEANGIKDANMIHVGQELLIPDPARVPLGTDVQSRDSARAAAAPLPALEQIPDTDPGPPFAILVSTVRIKENGYYKVTGMVRNDGAEIYGGIAVIATFFTDVQPPNWHGPVKVYAACQLLEPGAECPFSLEIYPRDYVAYHLHPEGAPVLYRRPAALALSNLSVYNDGVGYVRITGTATNENAFAVRDANIAGMLVDAAGQIASVGTALVPGEIAPGASVSFDLHIEQAPYAYYELQAQATQN